MPDLDRIYEHLLALRCQTGDAAAFEELVRSLHSPLRLYVRKMLNHDATVDDVLQEIWLAVHRGLHKLEDAAALRPWVYRIAHAKVCQTFRRRTPETINSDLTESIAADDDGDTFSAEDAAAIHRALDQLSPDHREVLILRFVEQMTYEQMARVTACGVGTVRSRLHYAKRALRAEIERQNDA